MEMESEMKRKRGPYPPACGCQRLPAAARAEGARGAARCTAKPRLSLKSTFWTAAAAPGVAAAVEVPDRRCASACGGAWKASRASTAARSGLLYRLASHTGCCSLPAAQERGA